MIPLLCSIFLANQDTGEPTEVGQLVCVSLTLCLLCNKWLQFGYKPFKFCVLYHILFRLYLQDEEAALLQGEREAEMMIIEAYSALLLAFLSTERFHFLLSKQISSLV